MELSEERRGGITVLRPHVRRLDAAVAGAFKDRALGAVARSGGHVVIDLSEVEFVDSSGLGAVVAVLKRLGPDGRLGLVGVRDTVATVLKLTRLDRVVPILEAAEDLLQGEAARSPAAAVS